ncbi:MAG: hypothetical protein WBG70_17665 [Spirulinaceae cyanobacterium]
MNTDNLKQLAEQIKQELEQIEQDANRGIEIARNLLNIFPDNAIIIGYFARFSNYLFFVESSRRGIESVEEVVDNSDVTGEEVKESGEYLSTLLGSTIEARMVVDNIRSELENLT